MKTYKRGISLIVLVITVIVLAILATTVIISLSNTNIIGEASDAVKKTNLQTYQEQADLAYVDWVLANKGQTLTNVDELKNHGFDASTLIGNYRAIIVNGVPKVLMVDVWDGVSVDTEFEGEGTEANPYKISSAAELAGLSSIMLTQPIYDLNCELTISIDLNNKSWTPIKEFFGNFDGNNNAIYNINVSNATRAGLFGYCAGVENLILIDGRVSGRLAGSIAGYVGLVSNCVNYGVEVTGTSVAGGIVGTTDVGTATDCINYGSVTAPVASGIAQVYVQSIGEPIDGIMLTGFARNCVNYGNVHGSNFVSGIAVPGYVDLNHDYEFYIYPWRLELFAPGSVNYGTVTGGSITDE